jgi:hypothetical protein
VSDAYRDLYGRRVNAVKRTATAGQEPARLAGVLLPPVEEARPARLHLDHFTTPSVTEADPAEWIITDERTAAERKADKRVQTCPAGRPVYRHGDLPAQQLATDTMLRRMRRRRRPGQAPVASYLMPSRGYAALYAVADAEELPPLSPARQEAWTRARTCALCGATRSTGAPYLLGHDEQRYCEPCQEPAAERCFRAQHAERRAAAAAWAREVLADPGAPLLVAVRPWYPSLHVMYANRAGEVLFDRRLQPGWKDHDADLMPPVPGTPSYVDPVDVAPYLRDVLTARRLIVWDYELDHLEHFLSDAVAGTVKLPIRDGDRFARHWAGWLGEREPTGPRAYRHNVRFRRPRWPDTPAEVITAMREGLAQMAAAAAEPAEEEL